MFNHSTIGFFRSVFKQCVVNRISSRLVFELQVLFPPMLIKRRSVFNTNSPCTRFVRNIRHHSIMPLIIEHFKLKPIHLHNIMPFRHRLPIQSFFNIKLYFKFNFPNRMNNSMPQLYIHTNSINFRFLKLAYIVEFDANSEFTTYLHIIPSRAMYGRTLCTSFRLPHHSPKYVHT